eukprot:3293025-Prymnesium_polylepis.4
MLPEKPTIEAEAARTLPSVVQMTSTIILELHAPGTSTSSLTPLPTRRKAFDVMIAGAFVCAARSPTSLSRAHVAVRMRARFDSYRCSWCVPARDS